MIKIYSNRLYVCLIREMIYIRVSYTQLNSTVFIGITVHNNIAKQTYNKQTKVKRKHVIKIYKTYIMAWLSL